MFTIVKFILDTVFSRYEYLCETLHPYSQISAIPCFMTPPPDLLYAATYKFHWDDTSNMTHLEGISTYICLIKKLIAY